MKELVQLHCDAIKFISQNSLSLPPTFLHINCL